jgi:hypothetical protein
LTRMGAWRIAHDGITMRPLVDDRIIMTTHLAARSEDKSRLVSEFVRNAMRKLNSISQPTQLSLAV